MNKTEKGIFIVYCILGLVGIIFAIMDVLGRWGHADIFWMAIIAVALVIECTQNWNKNRKWAILELIGGIIMLASVIGNKFIQ